MAQQVAGIAGMVVGSYAIITFYVMLFRSMTAATEGDTFGENLGASMIWPLWLIILPIRELRKAISGNEAVDDEEGEPKIVVRYEPRNVAGLIILWLWRIGITAAVAYSYWIKK